VTVLAEADAGHDDAMADAAASVALHLLDADLRVDLVCPRGSVEGASDDGRDRVLDLLARTSGGRATPDQRAAADVRVVADADGVTVSVGGDEYAFVDLTDPGGAVERARPEVVT
jgi:hypothetical protein